MDKTCIDKVYVITDILFVVFIITLMHPYSPPFVHMIYYSSMCWIAFIYSFTFIHIHPYPITIIHVSIFIHVFNYVYPHYVYSSFNDFNPHSITLIHILYVHPKFIYIQLHPSTFTHIHRCVSTTNSRAVCSTYMVYKHVLYIACSWMCIQAAFYSSFLAACLAAWFVIVFGGH